ncbi:hypothetical protein HFN89_05565 [Rhizobium laguerreae]|nr:hypothetical protein [Rhizobium laguerreae]
MVGLFLVVGLYRFFSVRVAAIATVFVIVGTFAFSAPFTITDAFWLSASGNQSPAAVTAIAADEASKDGAARGESGFSGGKVPSDLRSSSSASLPLGLIAYGFDAIAVIFNAIQLALIPAIVLSISGALIGSLKRPRAA